MKMKLAVAIALSALLLSTAEASPESSGRWKILNRNIGISAMHMQLFPNDKIVAYDRTDAGLSNISLPFGDCLNLTKGVDCTAHSIELNLANRKVRPLIVTTDTFCSSGALLSNGTLIQTGGYTSGERAVRYLSPCDNCDWIENLHGLAVRRWYSTNHILPDGRVIIVGGRDQPNYEFFPKYSPWELNHTFPLPFLSETTDHRDWENNLYPFVHLCPDGNLFVFANTKAILLDYVNNKVVKYFPDIPGGIARNYPSTGSSVLLPMSLKSNVTHARAEVMVCGGSEPTSFCNAKNGTFLPASNTCGRLVITDEAPQWQMEEMPIARIMGDMILLPTGDVLIINGAGKGSAGWEYARDPVMHPVLYKPGIIGNEGRSFEVLSPSLIPRVYHSTAHLASDGRVLVGGSNAHKEYRFSGVLFPTELSMEAFYPPYFGNKGLGLTRPQIITLEPGDDFGYGVRLCIGFTVVGLSSDVLKEGVTVTMVSPSFTTHSFSMNQRMLVLEVERFSRIRGERYEAIVVAPASTALAPAGYYMLFVVHGGVPSQGKWVHIGQW
ncbi:uncharacterized protein A4U43_C08F280 [Asparagus officinalis]|uniref:aldehyde oxidase GLOX1-like n=1 Tax=Asparagus officinalis TaxID=4686 RepID=UPI00098E325D|nr:aldehyde oxidase GLOX1-like [Asparagus officinalis]ONK58840.1 uncharacterized protein A4U43_C08F280 [Asparagus officinalis]